MPTKPKRKPATSSKSKAASSTSSQQRARQRALKKAGFVHLDEWAPAELAKEIRRAIAEATPGQGAIKGAAKPARKTPARARRAAPTSSPARQVDAGALPSTPKGRARAAQIAADLA